MLKLRKIAITGGVASGKSTVCQFFQELGAYIVSADAIVHELLDPQTDLGRQIIHILGPEILQNGTINRRVMAEKIFQDAHLLRDIERILHPAVLQRIQQRYQEACQDGKYASFVVEIPLLFEIGAEPFYDAVIAVIADERIAKKRFQAVGQTEQEYERRMNRQLAPSVKSAKAHYTILNNSSLKDLRREVERLNAILSK